MPELSLPDVTLHYDVSGEGPPLLLLAGMLSDSATWAPLLPLLEPYFTLFRADNRTTGRTMPRDAPVTVGKMVEDAMALIAHLGHDQIHIAGHSLGGLMGVEIAAQASERVASLSVLASAPVRFPRTIAVFDNLLSIRRSGPEGETLWLRALYPWIFGPKFFETPENVPNAVAAALAYPYGQSAEGMALQIEALRDFQPVTDMGRISCPVQTLFADQDILIPNDAARAAFGAIPQAEQHILPDAGHSIVWDAPDLVAERILAFIRGL